MFPMYLNTYHGIRTVDTGLIEMGRVYGLKSWQLFWDIVLPSALPSILVGLRYSLGIMWLTLICGRNDCDGFRNWLFGQMNAREFMQTDVIVFAILIYALLGKLADSIARFLETLCLQWHSAYQTSRPA